MDWDEASLAYNTYSLIKTGSDEYGNSWPILLRSFNDYKPALYAYLSIPAIIIFGLNEITIRLPSALAGSFIPALLYVIVFQVCKKSKLSLLISFLASVNPWLIQFSRGAFEANLGLFILYLGIALFLIIKQNNLRMLLGGGMMLLSIYAYHANKIVAPLTVAILLLISFLRLKNKKQITIPAFSLFILFIPFMLTVFRGEAFSRFNEVKINSGDFLTNFFSSFNFNFLFLNADNNLRHHLEGFGFFYVFESILMLVGVAVFIRHFRNKPKTNMVLLILLFITLLPGSISQNAPHAIRLLLAAPIFILLTGQGIAEFSKNKFFKIGLIAVYGYFILFYANILFKHYPIESAQQWQYGYKQVADYLFQNNNYQKYDKIVVTTAYDQPYIYMLLWSNGRFLNLKNPGTQNQNLDKIEFKKINYDEEKNKRNILLVGTEQELTGASKIIKTITYPNGEIALKIIRL